MAEKALNAFKENVDSFEQLVRLSPGNLEILEGAAISKLNLGSTLGDHEKEFENAIVVLNKAQVEFESILKTHPRRLNSRIGIGTCEQNLSAVANLARDFSIALKHADRAIDMFKQLDEQYSGHPQIGQNLSLSYKNRAVALEYLRRFGESIGAWETCSSRCRPRDRVQARLKLAAVLAKADSVDKSIEMLDEIDNSSNDKRRIAFQVGRVRALIAQAWIRSGDVQQDKLDDMLKLSIKALQLAVQHNKSDRISFVELLQNSSEFDALKNHNGFDELLDAVAKTTN